MSKNATLLIAVLMLSSLIIIGSAFAQSIPKPSVPEFSLKLAAYPYDVAPVTTMDPYTGKTAITQAGYHVENRSVEITITNQPFTPYSVDGSEVNAFYQVQFKGGFGANWQLYSHSNQVTPIQLTPL